MISVKAFSKAFSDLKVIDNISFDITEGEFVSIIGPSGCGKTTVLRCIAGLDKQYIGTILISNKNSKDYLEDNRISVVLQKYSNFVWLTVYENVLTALINSKLSEVQKSGLVDSLLSELKIDKFKDFYINQLSGGMQQRVAIARALAQDNAIVALDEPFGALDISNRYIIQVLLKKLSIKHKKTVLFVTHDIDEAIFLSDKIIVLSKSPTTISKIFSTPFKNEFDTSIKYSTDFLNLKKEIELTFKL